MMLKLLKKHPIETAVVFIIFLVVLGVASTALRKERERSGERVLWKQVRAGMVLRLTGPTLSQPVVAKVLLVNRAAEGLHVRTYEPGGTETMTTSKRDPLALHVALSRTAWRDLTAEKLKSPESVSRADLEGYEEWQRSAAAYYYRSLEAAGPLLTRRSDGPGLSPDE